MQVISSWIKLIPSGKLTQLWKISIFIYFIHYKWPFSLAISNYQRAPRFLVESLGKSILQNGDDHNEITFKNCMISPKHLGFNSFWGPVLPRFFRDFEQQTLTHIVNPKLAGERSVQLVKTGFD